MTDSIYFSLDFNSSICFPLPKTLSTGFWLVFVYCPARCTVSSTKIIQISNNFWFDRQKKTEKIVVDFVCNKVQCWVLKFTAYFFIIWKDNFFRRPETQNSSMRRIALNFIFIFVRLIRVAPLSLLRTPFAVSLHCQKIEASEFDPTEKRDALSTASDGHNTPWWLVSYYNGYTSSKDGLYDQWIFNSDVPFVWQALNKMCTFFSLFCCCCCRRRSSRYASCRWGPMKMRLPVAAANSHIHFVWDGILRAPRLLRWNVPFTSTILFFFRRVWRQKMSSVFGQPIQFTWITKKKVEKNYWCSRR